MRELIKTLYEVSGSYSNKITRMLIFDVFKGVFEGISLGAILFCLTKICENVFRSCQSYTCFCGKLYAVFLAGTFAGSGF